MKFVTCLARTAAIGVIATAFAGGVVQAQPFIDDVRKSCAKELKTYCAKVTPGEGRLAFCLLSYENKLSRVCDNSLFYAATELAKMVSARAVVVQVCEPDARRLCAGVKPGDGNILSCLNLAQKALTAKCNQAIVDARLR